MLRVCDSCMRQLLSMQAAGQIAVKCPNCTCDEIKGKKFGKKHVVFNVKM
jgi:phage FluMu protein Com